MPLRMMFLTVLRERLNLAGYLSNCFAFSKMSLTDFTDGFHVQHLLSILLSLMNSREYGAGC